MRPPTTLQELGFAWPRQWPRLLAPTGEAAPFRASGLLVDYPLGCDFTPVEQRLVRALAWLKSATASRGGKLRTIAKALSGTRAARDAEALARMDLSAPRGLGQWLEQRLVSLALARTHAD